MYGSLAGFNRQTSLLHDVNYLCASSVLGTCDMYGVICCLQLTDYNNAQSEQLAC